MAATHSHTRTGLPAISDANFLTAELDALVAMATPEGAILWSGTLSEGLFDRDPRAWGPASLDQLKARFDELAPLLASAGTQILLRTHARHVLCDPQRCMSFFAARQGAPIGLSLDAAAMLEADMLPKAEDHLRRAFEALGSVASAIVATNVTEPGDAADEEAPLTLTPLLKGALDPAMIAALIAAHCPAATPRILLGPDIGAQERLLAQTPPAPA